MKPEERTTTTPTEKRLEREEDRILSSQQRYARVEGERAPTYRTHALRYRDDFGTTMDDEQHKAAVAQQKAFKESINQARGQLSASQQRLQEAYGSGQQQIIDGTQIPKSNFKGGSDLVPLRVVNGNTVEATYMVPREYISNLQGNEMFNKGDGTLAANWVDNNKYFNVDVKVIGGRQSSVAGKELHETFSKAEQDYRASLDSARSQYNQQYSQAQQAAGITRDSHLSALNTEYGTARESLSAQQGQIDAAVKQNTQHLTTIKVKYQERLQRIRETLGI